MRTSENIQEIAKAMSLAQKDIKPAAKDGVNPHFRSSFSTLSAIWEAIRQPLTDNSLTLWQDVVTEDKSVSVTTRIVHNSGQWVEFGPLSMPLVKFDPQAIGSATSYAKRYALCAAIGVVSDEDGDDDGENAQGRGAIQTKYVSSPQKINVSSPQKINASQINTIKQIDQKLDAECKDKLYKWMKSTYKVDSIEELTVEHFTKTLSAFENALKFIEQNKLDVAHA